MLITDIAAIPPLNRRCGLTIGNFDGVHLGHQTLLRDLRKKIGESNPLVVFTFSNHPSSLFRPDKRTCQIYPPLHKVKLLQSYGVDLVILLSFTKIFAETPFDQFLSILMQKMPFSHLLLGQGATFGKNREGDQTKVRALAEKMGFEADYLPKIPGISSGHIRTLIARAEFSSASACLGRPYSIVGDVREGKLNATGLCLPPEGSYSVAIENVGTMKMHLANQQVHLDAPLTMQDVELVLI